MPKKDSYAHGTPSWVDIASTDLDATHAFYSKVFGWETQLAGPVEETGGYGFYTKGGEAIAGFGPLTAEAQAQGQPPTWSTYIAVDDTDKVCAQATANGATVVVEPMDVMTAGRMAFFVDPTGAFVGLWQAGDHTGAGLVNEPGAVCWNELIADDPAKAAAFYTEVFGHTSETMDMGGMDYTVLKVDDQPAAGVMGKAPEMGEAPNHWSVVFAVDDCDASLETIKAAGGTVLAGPFDVPVGRSAAVADPHGVPFQIIKLNG